MPVPTRRHVRTAALALLALIGVLGQVPPAAAQIEAPPPIPAGLTRQATSQLALQRQTLMIQRDGLVMRIDMARQNCSRLLNTDHGLVGPCQDTRMDLAQEIGDYRAALAHYRLLLDTAERDKPAPPSEGVHPASPGSAPGATPVP
jgi:hypothetical protein